MVLMGLGMGLISTPATESILLVLPPARAGVGSAVNDATRELGGTLGVAVVGSIFASVYAAQLADGPFGQLPGRRLHAGAGLGRGRPAIGARSAGARGRDAGRLHGRPAAPRAVVIGLLCLAGAVGAALALPGRLRPAPVDAAGDAEDAAAETVPA